MTSKWDGKKSGFILILHVRNKNLAKSDAQTLSLASHLRVLTTRKCHIYHSLMGTGK